MQGLAHSEDFKRGHGSQPTDGDSFVPRSPPIPHSTFSPAGTVFTFGNFSRSGGL